MMRTTAEESSRGFQERVRSVVGESRSLHQDVNAGDEEGRIRLAMHVSSEWEYGAGLTAREEDEVQRLLAESAQDHSALVSQEEVEI